MLAAESLGRAGAAAAQRPWGPGGSATRWTIAAAPSLALPSRGAFPGVGRPAFAADAESATGSPAEPGEGGRWIMEWNPMERLLREPSPAAAPLLSLVLPRLPTDRLRQMERGGSSARKLAPLVIVGKVRERLRPDRVDAVAERAGLVPGLPLATARAMLPALRVAEADPAADAALLDSVADWAERYTPFVGWNSRLEAPGSRTTAPMPMGWCSTSPAPRICSAARTP